MKRYFKLSFVGVLVMGLLNSAEGYSVRNGLFNGACPVKYTFLFHGARVVRGESIKSSIRSFLFNDRGQWFSKEMLIRELELVDKEGVPEAVLRELESQGSIFSYSGLYIIPRERLVEKEFQDKIEAINKDAIYFSVPTRTVSSFKRDFLNYISILEKTYENNLGEIGKTDFFQYFLPQAMFIYKDDIFGLRKSIREFLDELAKQIRKGEQSLDDLTSIWQEPIIEPEEIEKWMLFQEQAPEILEKIVETVNLSLVNNEYTDNVIGFLVFGSWVKLVPRPDSDLDIKIITKTAFSHEKEEIEAIKTKLEEVLSNLAIDRIDIGHGFSLDEQIRRHDFEDEAPPLFGRFGILRDREYLIIAKSSELLGEILEKIEQLSEY